MVSLDEPKERVSRVEVWTVLGKVRVLLPQPATAVRVVIHGYDVLLRHDGRNNYQLDGQSCPVTTGSQDGAAAIDARSRGRRNPEVDPERLSLLTADAIVGFWEAGAVRNLGGNESVRIIALRAFGIMKPLPVDAGLNPATSPSQVALERLTLKAAQPSTKRE